MQARAMLATLVWISIAGHTEGATPIGSEMFEARMIDVEGSTIAIADVNGDGRMDILSAGRRLSVQLGDGAGGLRAAMHAPAGDQPADLAFADVNQDSLVDIVIANHETHYVMVLIGDGRGGFALGAHSPVAVDVDPHPHDVDAVDIDGDGLVDLLVDHSPRGPADPGLRRDAGGVLVMRGLGGGRFESPGEVFESGGVPYRGFAVGDVNTDGRPDLVTPHGRDMGVLLNWSEAGRVSFERAGAIPATAPFLVKLGDLNGDGAMDIVSAAGEDLARVEVFFNDGHSGFESAPQSPFQHARGGKNIALGDFNGDGVTDAAVSAYRSTDVLIILGGRHALETVRVPAGHDSPWGLAAGDLNGDGLDDLMIVGDGARRARLYMSVVE